MTTIGRSYAQVLQMMHYDPKLVAEMRALLEHAELTDALDNPTISRSKKHAIIEKIFPQAVVGFLKVMSDHEDIAYAGDLFEAYDEWMLEHRNAVQAVFEYVSKPDDAQIQKLKQMICKKYGKDAVELELEEHPELLGGFVLRVGNSVLDKSIRTSILKMQRHFAMR